MENKKVFIKLCIMMFMQYFIFAVWWVPFAAYLEKSLQLSMGEVSLILCAMAIGSMASSIIGVLADRRFAAEKVLAALNLLTALCLFVATQQTTFVGLMITVTLTMLCYMPTWSLTSSIAMTHVPAEQFPRMRLIGSIGWFASGAFSLVAIYVFHLDVFDGSVFPMYCGIGAGIIAAILNLTLPNTPPAENKRKFSLMDIFGLRTLSILKNKNYNIFIFLTFLAIIPFNLYHVYGSTFFSDVDVKNITVTMNWGVAVEMIFLFVTTIILMKCGFKKTLLFGLIAMLLRYLSFYLGVEFGQPWLYSIGVLTHGIIFGLFFVVGQVYTDKVAPAEIRAEAQGFLSFLVWGVGYLIGTLVNGYLIGNYRLEDTADWSIVFGISAVFTLIIIVLFTMFFKNTDNLLEEKNNN
ncbi:MFS transporter [Dysgonomonas sp. Marseille-P4361]|uniref:MFS transporter n=1 Tax=Dysgonomonas sp. Marseille-P4361 TaxID=2161820 RepID=UPI000D55AF45|nr:MFS transporter [Dysgonomonas sp. Marseille-P4361]